MTTNSNNPEIMQRWYTIGIWLNYEPVFMPAEDWISSMGRLKYLEPIYQSLMDNGNTTVANDWYTNYGSFYSRTAQNAITMIVMP